MTATTGSPLGVLRNRRFRALWIAQVVTQVGSNMVLFGLTVQVFTLTGKSTAVSLLILSFLVPAVIFGAIAGVYTDRNDRRLILVVTNAVRAVLFIVLLLVHSDLALIYLLTVVISTITTFFGPAEAAMIPVIVPRAQLLPANSLYLLTFQGSFFLGFTVLGPLIVNVSGPWWLFVLVSATYLIGASLCLLLPSNNPRSDGARPTEALAEAGEAVATTFYQLADGIRFVFNDRAVRWPLAYLTLTASLIGVLAVLAPAFANEVLGLSERDAVVLLLPLGVGLVLGVLLLNVYGHHFSRRRGIEGGLVALGLALLALAFTQDFTTSSSISRLSVVIAIAFAGGIAYAFVAVPAQTQLQEELPENVRGRIFGVLNMLVSLVSFLPIIVVGPIADVIGPEWVVASSGVLALATATGSIRQLRSVGKQEPIAADERGEGLAGLSLTALPNTIVRAGSLLSSNNPQPEDVFTPSAPASAEMFVTRRDRDVQRRVEQAIREPGTQLVVFGETGVGKTSLVLHLLNRLSLRPARVECGDSFVNLLREALSTVSPMRTVKTRRKVVGGVKGNAGLLGVTVGAQGSVEMTTEHEPTQRQIASLTADTLESEGINVLVFDNYENNAGSVDAEATARALGQFIKLMSDRSLDGAAHLKVIVIGIPTEAEGLITLDRATARRTRQIEVQGMTGPELGSIIDRGAARLHLSFPEPIRESITNLSGGFPYYTHLLALHCAQRVIEDGRSQVDTTDMQAAVAAAVEDVALSVRSTYERAGDVDSGRPLRLAILRVLANEPSPYLSAAAISEKLGLKEKPDGSPTVKDSIDELVRDGVLSIARVGRRSVVTFDDPLMGPFVRLKEFSPGDAP